MIQLAQGVGGSVLESFFSCCMPRYMLVSLFVLELEDTVDVLSSESMLCFKLISPNCLSNTQNKFALKFRHFLLFVSGNLYIRLFLVTIT